VQDRPGLIPAVRRSTTLARAGGFAALFVLGLAYSTGAFDRFDEAWFLQVVARVRGGDALYRDVWYGSGPLPVYLTEAVTWLVGVEIIAVKLVVVAAFAASALLAWLIARRLGIGAVAALAVVAAIAYFSPAIPLSAYGPLSEPFVLATLLAALAWVERPSTLAAVAGGAAAGFAFSSKQNVGAYVLAALLVVFAVQQRRQLRGAAQPFALALAGFLGAAFLALLPTLATGGLGTYIRRGFTGKTTYVHYSSLTYSNALHSYFRSLGQIHTEAAGEAAYWATGILLPLLAAAAFLAIVPAWRRLDRRAVPVLTFALVGFASLYPLGDAPHVVNAAGPLVIVCAYALHVWLPRVPRVAARAVVAALAVWLGVAVLLSLARPLRLARSGAAELSTLPHIHGTFVETSKQDEFRSEARMLAASAQRLDGPLFLLMPDAGFRYLTSGLRNPTPYDYPIVTTFGPHGQDEVFDDLVSGRIRNVCYGWWTAGLVPTKLVTYVRTRMKPGRDLGPCTLYSR